MSFAIKVGHIDVKVSALHPDDSRNHAMQGMFDSRRAVIGIALDYPPAEQADTLIHELLHAIWYNRRLPDRAEEEEAVANLATGLAAVLRDNPTLPGILMAALTKRKALPL